MDTMPRSALQAALVGIFEDSLGVAAEFVIEDALAELDTHPEWQAHRALMQAQFLIILGRHLPPEVPYAQLRTVVAELIKRHSFDKK